ncbi:2-dehydro-3-deoxygalactonokinase [Persicobacter diffluens]|uniref:2-dehydro-3-deoxygalactonokinase n=1 Tax=Persicobacter diffluens TaxID=981 RepID=A0AAN4W402_9BACT|nr:2-dehydro-3-deoxygalactonokinase [Persicobacter diffluens]
MQQPEHFISCDWGTSNLRLRLVDKNSLEVLQERKSNVGVKSLNQDFRQQNEQSQTEFFSQYLIQEIEKLVGNETAYQVVASGMVTSTLGLKELPYVAAPFAASGETLYREALPLNERLQLILVSGVHDDAGVMRGEEIQAVGLADVLNVKDHGVLLLPGTHSKHMSFEAGHFTRFKTFMTGELFDLISTKSILSASVKAGDFDEKARTAFLRGVAKAAEGQSSASLFSIRALDLLQKTTATENFYFLSGLLIGEELRYLQQEKQAIAVAASGILEQLYRLALTTIVEDQQRLTFITAAQFEHAFLLGQRKILATYE